MDLSRMTRDELEREATRRGVREVTHLTRAQLIRAIEAPPATGAIDTAKAIFRGVLGVARTLRGRASTPPPPPAPSRPSPAPRRDSPAPNAAPDGERTGDTQRMRVSETPAGLPAVSRPANELPASDLPARASVEVEPRPTLERTDPTNKMKLPSYGAEDEASATLPEAPVKRAAPSQRDTAVTMDLGPLRDEILLAADPQPVVPDVRAIRESVTVPIRPPLDLEDEPIPTRTMARLLHEQGHHRRALAILENLLAQRPGDLALEADLVAVQRALRVPKAEVVAGARAESPRSELVTLLLPDRRVLLAWGLSEESIASARSMGASGTLVARVLVLAPGSDGAVTRTLTDKDAQSTGEHTIGPIAPGSFVTAAVGFRDGDQFVSVAAAPVLDVN